MIRAGRVVCRAGEPAQGGYLIINGTLAFELQRGSNFENSDPHFHLREGNFFGECALLIPTMWDVTLYSYTPVTLMHIPRKDFLRLLIAHPTAIPPIQHTLEAKVHTFLTACNNILA
jgi:CRP-like cAMP-binding protein